MSNDIIQEMQRRELLVAMKEDRAIVRDLCELLHVEPRGLPERVRRLIHQRDSLKKKLEEKCGRV